MKRQRRQLGSPSAIFKGITFALTSHGEAIVDPFDPDGGGATITSVQARKKIRSAIEGRGGVFTNVVSPATSVLLAQEGVRSTPRNAFANPMKYTQTCTQMFSSGGRMEVRTSQTDRGKAGSASNW